MKRTLCGSSRRALARRAISEPFDLREPSARAKSKQGEEQSTGSKMCDDITNLLLSVGIHDDRDLEEVTKKQRVQRAKTRAKLKSRAVSAFRTGSPAIKAKESLVAKLRNSARGSKEGSPRPERDDAASTAEEKGEAEEKKEGDAGGAEEEDEYSEDLALKMLREEKAEEAMEAMEDAAEAADDLSLKVECFVDGIFAGQVNSKEGEDRITKVDSSLLSTRPFSFLLYILLLLKLL